MHAGLVTEVPANFRVYILEYMAHLSLQDWKAVGNDFVNLQFVAPGSMHPNDIPGLMDAVGGVLEVLMLGGGAKNLENIRVRTPHPFTRAVVMNWWEWGGQLERLQQRRGDGPRWMHAGSHPCASLPSPDGAVLQDKNLLDNVGLDPGEMDQAGFMDGFATVRQDPRCMHAVTVRVVAGSQGRYTVCVWLSTYRNCSSFSLAVQR